MSALDSYLLKQLLVYLRQHLTEKPERLLGPHGRLQTLRHDEPTDMIEILFRDGSRPGCLFGFRWSLAESVDPRMIADDVPHFGGWILTILEEYVVCTLRLRPASCGEDDGVFWLTADLVRASHRGGVMKPGEAID